MIRVLLLIFALAAPTFEQKTPASTPKSPCPKVFMYEPPGSEPGRWYGVVNLSTDSTLYALWLNIVLDSKADILGNWIGDVTTQDNIDFKVENTDMRINPGPPVPVRFFVQYNTLNRIPMLRAIRMNGREICNADNPQSDNEERLPSNTPGTRPQIRDPVTTRPFRPSTTEEDRIKPVFVRPVETPTPTNIGGGDVPSQNIRPQATTTARPVRRPVSRPNVSTMDDEEYFGGGRPVLNFPPRGSTNSNQKCGKVPLNDPIPLVVNGSPTLEGQWPWQIALYQTQTVDNKYICGGTLVSHRHVITAAHCVTRKGSTRIVNQNTLTVFLGKHNLRTSVDGVQIKFVGKITVHPDYNGTTYSRDVAILELKDSVAYTDWVQPACLWPESQVHLNNVIGKRGSVVGWGFDETGVATEELSLVEMPVVDTETCIRSYSDFFVRFTSDYTYCAGFRDGSSVCNGDSGGGMVFRTDNVWYLRGLVSVAVPRQNEYRCDPSHYVIFTDLAKFLPWINQNVYDF